MEILWVLLKAGMRTGTGRGLWDCRTKCDIQEEGGGVKYRAKEGTVSTRNRTKENKIVHLNRIANVCYETRILRLNVVPFIYRGCTYIHEHIVWVVVVVGSDSYVPRKRDKHNITTCSSANNHD